MKLLVCGGRDFNDYIKLDQAMVLLPFKPDMIIQGGAKGADAMARVWAENNGVPHVEVPALWNFHGKKAGYLRNASMLLLDPGYCMAMPGGRGTDDMVRQCEKAKIPVWRPYG